MVKQGLYSRPGLCLGTHCPGGSASRGSRTRGRASQHCVPRQSLGTRFSMAPNISS